MCLLLRPVIFRRVAMLSVVVFGMFTVEQALIALKNWGASSPPVAFRVHGAAIEASEKARESLTARPRRTKGNKLKCISEVGNVIEITEGHMFLYQAN